MTQCETSAISARRVCTLCTMFAPMADTTERPPLTVEEVAERLNLSKRQVYYLLDSGEIPSLRYPGRTETSDGIRRVEAHEVDAFMERSRKAAAS